MPKITAISDTHTKHSKLIIDPTDILIHCGDFSYMGREGETIKFLKWFDSQPAIHKIFISGNHDSMDDLNPGLFKDLLKEHAPDTIYLRNEGCEVEGIKFWGFPITPTFGYWYFMADPDSMKMRSALSRIPNDINILITHGPAYGILDKTIRNGNVGCKNLLDELERIKPQYHLFGHIHESAGSVVVGNTTHINCSVLNESYNYTNKPTVFTTIDFFTK